MKVDRKIRFPFGIFILLLLLFCIFSTSVTAYIYYNNTKDQIQKIEADTKTYTLSLIEASGQIAEGYSKKFNPKKLNSFFKDGQTKGLYYKAFFVLKNAHIIAHSNLSEKKELKNNIATEEMRYNLAQIFLPLESKISKTFFLEYNITEQPIPFNWQEIKYMKEYLYENIDRNGWLATRAVTRNKKRIGTVNFIISKEKIYNAIKMNLEEMLQYFIILGITSFVIALLISLISMIRFQSFKIKVLNNNQPYPANPVMLQSDNVRQPKDDMIITSNTGSAKSETQSNVHHIKAEPVEVNIVYEDSEEESFPQKLNIQNAIPVHRRKFK